MILANHILPCVWDTSDGEEEFLLYWIAKFKGDDIANVYPVHGTCLMPGSVKLSSRSCFISSTHCFCVTQNITQIA